MKKSSKIVSVLIAAAMVLSFVACSAPSPSPSISAPVSVAPTASSDATPASAAPSSIDISTLSGTFTMWLWDIPNQQKMLDLFNQVYPNIKCNMVNVSDADMLTKYQAALNAGTGIPDVVWCERSRQSALIALNSFENLEAAPYNLDRSLWLDSVVPYMTDANDHVVGFDLSLSPAAFAYNKDLTQQYFGTSDETALEQMFPTWDSMIAKAADMYQQSGGKVYMFASYGGMLQCLLGQMKDYMVKDKKLNLETTAYPVLDTLVKMKDANACGLIPWWTPAYNAALDKGSYIFTYSASWYPSAVLETCPDLSGKLGLMHTPEGDTNWGGTLMCIPQDAQNKDLAYAFLNYMFGTKDGAKIVQTTNQLVGLKDVVSDPAMTKNDNDPFFPGIDIGNFFYSQVAPNTNSLMPNADNDLIVNNIITAVAADIFNNNLTLDQAKAEMLDLIQKANYGFTQ